MTNVFLKLAGCFFLCLLTAACSGVRTFSDYARAGDTVALAAGWKTNFNKNNISITITPSVGADIFIPANSPAIRAAVNMYPDPVSSAIVSRAVAMDQTPNARLYSSLIEGITGGDQDWYQTTILLDLPAGLPVGTTQILIANTQGETATSTLEIIQGAGAPHQFTANSGTAVNSNMFLAMQRAENYAVKFDGPVIPYAIEVNLLHDPDVNNSGVGKAFVINPTGFNKNIIWSGFGTSIKVILSPSDTAYMSKISDFKFYVAGKIQNLSVGSIQAYDVDGNLISGVNATINKYDL